MDCEWLIGSVRRILGPTARLKIVKGDEVSVVVAGERIPIDVTGRVDASALTAAVERAQRRANGAS